MNIAMLKKYRILLLLFVSFLALFIIFAAGCATEDEGTTDDTTQDGDQVEPGGTGSISGFVQDAVAYYGDSSESLAADGSRDSGLSGATITVKSGSTEIATGTTGSTGAFSLTEVTAGTGYTVVVSKTDYLSVTVYGIDVVADETTILELVNLIDSDHAGEGDAGGRIKDAFSGDGVSSASITLRAGMNATSGSTVDTATTDEYYGDYEFTGVDAGVYTAQVSASGYITGYFTVVVIGDIMIDEQNYSVTKTLEAGQVRVVLTWGSTPSDLDSHMTGPVEGETQLFHVYYGAQGVDDDVPYCELDWDDVSSYGPETITVYQEVTGEYQYYVHDFSSYSGSSSMVLASSGAQVNVYDSTGLAATFNVPNSAGTAWYVFKRSGGVITPINTVSDYSVSDISGSDFLEYPDYDYDYDYD